MQTTNQGSELDGEGQLSKKKNKDVEDWMDKQLESVISLEISVNQSQEKVIERRIDGWTDDHAYDDWLAME